ncbi:hypothetical protein SPRG_01214 [Saprolegnia parasitica CBS 223.65]|uniref:Uncharacterized protein n=1 Tax=Saprolegnia parasitica (strain CBS 223.65) TaxID=695850 RepID=A0A067D819_SAPPC|nr:hypothetical protein SPRG_01214 [Saprolegnia parasitica CBS 223.65]KDO35147.1 hypothetical protein SPRG_01214 [Saprolegnia parasitica CBS 223.65]|eukprot:XP_012194795.1 hypothetical protein SPRG_01214 [Saprolegnia parasitica CBS 223.65]
MIVPEAPRATLVPAGVQRAGRWQQCQAALSAVYLIASMGIGYYYLHLVRSSLASDLWWRGFTTTGAQTFLGDLYHRRLQLSTPVTMSLASPELVLEKTYAGATFMDMSPSLSRHVLLRNLSLESVLPPMRRSSFAWNIRMFTQYCWVDWNHTYELSATAARQRRCYLKQAANAAVYWEPLLRNTVTQDILLGPYGVAMNISLFQYIGATSAGHNWLVSLMHNEWLPEADEVELWRRAGLTYWQTELTNYYEQGLQQTIVVENALGIQQNMTIHLMAQSYRGLALWTLASAYAGVWNDLLECQARRCSLIRGANSYSDNIKQNWEVLLLAIPVNKTLPKLIDANIGPMASIDVRIVPLPPALQAYYANYQRSIVAPLLLSPVTAAGYMQVPALVAAVSPPAWRGVNMTYFGGNPMCLNAKPQLFVQDQFGFYDACDAQAPAIVIGTRPSLLFSLATLAVTDKDMLHRLDVLCSGCARDDGYHDCMATLKPIAAVVTAMDLSSLAIFAGDLALAMMQLNLSMIQLGVNGTSSVFLTQRTIAHGDPWSFFGWTMVYDWLQGTREAVEFDTDTGAYMILTPHTAPSQLPASPLELPNQVCSYVWLILLYSSLLMGVVATLVLLASLRSHGGEVFAFHRVASLVWVGRPFLMLRGTAALVILSTSPMQFASADGITRFVFAPRTPWDVIVLSSEATWITYALVDFALPVAEVHAKFAAPLSALIAWLATLLIEVVAPYEATATFEQSCEIMQLGLAATCAGGVVRIGSRDRLGVLLLVHVSSVIVSFLAVIAWRRRGPIFNVRGSDLLPASAQVFLARPVTWHTRPTTVIMAGMFPLAGRMFVVNLWQVLTVNNTLQLPSQTSYSSIRSFSLWKFGYLEIGGIIYVITSVVASYTYIYISSTAMTNDFWWANFNASGHQTFLTNWFTQQLQTSNHLSRIDLTNLSFSDNSNLYNVSSTTAAVPMLYASMIQDEANSLTNVIAGLRSMDGCLTPWIASSYCYLDFNQTWELATSAYRQAQCRATETTNGAVYLEGLLRNANHEDLQSCWGDSLQIGFFDFLETSLLGQAWLVAMRTNALDVASEAAYWRQHGISVYVTQWQNYKALGVIETYSIQNAFGISYPLTLKYSNGSLHTNQQTSFKMQWPLASLLWAVASNSSGIGGRSLVRQSPTYGFANATVFMALTQNGTISSPLDVGGELFVKAIGPFGSVDLRRVAYPPSLVAWYTRTREILNQRLALANSSVVSAFRSIGSAVSISAAPAAWREGVTTSAFRGGDITCPIQVPGATVNVFYSNVGVCAGHKGDVFIVDGLMTTHALLALGPGFEIGATCAHATMQRSVTCNAVFGASLLFLSSLFTVDEWTTTSSAAPTALLQSELRVAIAHFINASTDDGVGRIELRNATILDPKDPGFHAFGWLYLLEWLHGIREVVEFQSAHGALALLSTRNAVHIGPVNALEIPVNVAFFCRCELLYVSSVLLLVACLAIAYIAATRGCIEGFNMFSLNRVTGLVWLGRPLLLLRGVTALCLLSTAKLDLGYSNGFFHLVSQPQSWFTTIMAASEATWVVYLLNDAFSIVTQQYTAIYADVSSIAVWIAAAIWSLVSPVQHQVTLARTCDAVAVDSQLVCHAGILAIGDVTRFTGLLGLAVALVFGTYAVQRLRFPQLRDTGLRTTLLHATAFHHFKQDGWVFQNVYHMDRASAAFNGLLSLPWGSNVLDIKTWRLYARPVIDIDKTTPPYLAHTIPAYLLITTALGVYFLILIQPSVTNDLWWAGFTTAGAQTFLADVFHRRLQLQAEATLPLCAPEVLVEKNYSVPSFIDMRLSMSRQVLLANISFDAVIPALRQTSFAWNARMFAQYCWVDWNRTYELSITAKRRARCVHQQRENAGAYWEPLLRNSYKLDVLNSTYGVALQIVLFDHIQSSESGAAWLNELWAHPWPSVADENHVWRRAGLTYWQTQLTNYYEQGLQETIMIENALGIRTNVTIHLMAQSYRGLPLWSLVSAYEGIWNDIAECQARNCSLIHGANNYSDSIKLDWERVVYGLKLGTTLPDLIDANMGAMGSIDVFFVQTPSALQQYYAAYQAGAVVPLLKNAPAAEMYKTLAPLTIDAVPRSWRGDAMSYFTGNAMCVSAAQQPFVQDQFGFYDACTVQKPSILVFSRQALLFALVTFESTSRGRVDIPAICGLATTTDDACDVSLATLQRVQHTIQSLPSTDVLSAAMSQLNLTLIQLAMNGSRPTFLTQTVLAAQDAFSFFGWAMVYDWLQGDREVYAFQTDEGSYTLMSPYLAPTPFPANALELPQQACKYVWYILVYSSALMSLVALAVLAAAMHENLHVTGMDLIAFHRVASPTWVGRPFLLLRGVVALTVLATSPVVFVAEASVARFVFEPRPAIDVMVLASEGSWITYVVVDLFLPTAECRARLYAPLSAVMAWCVYVLWETIRPFEASLHVQQTCRVVQLGLRATCSGGVVQVGSAERLFLYVCVGLLSILGAWLLVRLWWGAECPPRGRQSELLPAAAQIFLLAAARPLWFQDPTTTLLAGIVPVRRRFFHVNLWQFVRLNPLLLTSVHPKARTSNVPVTHGRRTSTTVLGIVYVLFSVGGSFTYIYLSSTAMTNDFWWANFNASGHQTFLTNWFTQQLQASNHLSRIDLTNLSFSDNSNLYNLSSTTAAVPMLYASMIQDEANSLTKVIAGLRSMDGCLTPWIASSYCYLDFNQTWELATSAYRQAQCRATETTNGAVYLEGLLRNANHEDLHRCWGNSLEIGFFDYLETSLQGQAWLVAMQTNALDVASEAAYWRQHGISVYVTQWQNYKALGVIETYSIQNAFGISYPLTLKYSNGSLHTNQQTSFKMQWPLASLLWAVASNSSGIGGDSLVRQSPQFAFRNASIATALAMNSTLEYPLDVGLALIAMSLGPFGTIEMRRIAYPATLLAWRQALLATFNAAMAQASDASHEAFRAIGGSVSFTTAPAAWSNRLLGGDLMCPTQSEASFVGIFFSNLGACTFCMGDNQVVDARLGSLALLASGPSVDVAQTCASGTLGTSTACQTFLSATKSYLKTAFSNAAWARVAAASIASKHFVQTQLPVVLVQFMANATGTHFVQSSLFDDVDPGFHLFGWLYVLEWLAGSREVVTFSSADGAYTVLSGRNPVHIGPVNPLEVPVNVALYFRGVLLYVSSVLFFVACLACGYIVSSHGHIEGYNMLALNRVTGLVWIGRPLIFLRGITAVCLLSTAKLDLMQSHGFFYLVSVPQLWLTTVMAAGETTWLVFILNDAFSVATHQYTSLYAAPSSLLVWLVAAIWTLTLPVDHYTDVHRTCIVPAVDLQLVCDSGVIFIGDLSRCLGLLGLVVGLVIASYGIQRLRFPNATDTGIRSHLLYATAYHHFKQDTWVFHGVYHIDRASAVINGLLSLQLRDRRMLLLDIKTWRLFALNLESLVEPDFPHLGSAIPLY